MCDHIDYCAKKLRKNDYSQYLCNLYLPAGVRTAAHSIYAFNNEIHRISHVVSQPLPGEIRIQWWRDAIAGKCEISSNPIAKALLETIDKYKLSKKVFDELLEARIFDLYNDPISTQHELETYLGQTRSVLLQMLSQIGGQVANYTTHADDASLIADASGHAGIVVGISELLSDHAYHHHHERSYFPADLSGEKTSQGKVANNKWLNDISNYATGHYEHAAQAISELPKTRRQTYLPLIIANNIIRRIASNGLNLDRPYQPISNFRTHISLWHGSRNFARRIDN